MNRQAMPDYRRAADAIRARITTGAIKVGDGLKVPEIERLTGISYATARVVAKQLEAEGILQAHQGKGYEVVATPEAATAQRVSTTELARQVSQLRDEVRKLSARQDATDEKLERVDSGLEEMNDRLGYEYAAGGTDERGEPPATAARRGRAG